MSRCPDAILCESVFDQVLDKVGPKVDMSLVFIAMCVRQFSYYRPDNMICITGGTIQYLTGA